MGAAELFTRSGDDKAVCPMPAHLVPDAPEKFIGDYSFHEFNEILSGCCSAITCLVIFAVMARHALRYSDPNQQVKIMRIATLSPLYTIYSLLSICFPNAYVYMNGWTKFIQGLAMYWFLMLLCDFMAPNDRHRPEFFASLRVPNTYTKGTSDGLSFLKRTWISVLQYPIVAFILAIVQSVTQAQGTYCLEGKGAHFSKIYITVINIISLYMAIFNIIRFHKHLKSYMGENKPMQKLIAFKMVVGLEFLEQIIFMILDATNTLKPSATLSYADIIIGIPTMIICLQVVPFAFFFFHAFNLKPYTKANTTRASDGSQQYLAVDGNEAGSPLGKRYKGGPLGIYAWIELFNPGELYHSIRNTWRMFREAKMGKSEMNLNPEPYA